MESLRPHRSMGFTWRRLALAVFLPFALVACDDDDGPTGPEGSASVVGTWTVTSFEALGMDGIALGMSMTVTLTQGGTYTIDVQNDQLGLCEPDPNCTPAGTYRVEGSQILMDEDSEDEIALTYTRQGNTMVWSGALDGIPITVSLALQ